MHPLYNAELGPRQGLNMIANSTIPSYAMATLNTGWAARFQAQDTRDIYAVYLHWSTVSAAGVVTIRIETDSGGKPSGTLYDANATVTSIPTSGSWKLATFATPPSTGLVAGNLYHVVVLTTTGNTTQTLHSHVATGAYPCCVLQATNGTTRSNFAEMNGTTPLMSLVLSDASETGYGGVPYYVGTQQKVFGTAGFGAAFTVPSGESWSVAGVNAIVSRTGPPTSDLKVSIYSNSSGAAPVIISGATVSISNNALLNSSGKNVRALFPAPVALGAGTYRVIHEQADHSGDSTHFYGIVPAVGRAAGVVPSSFTQAGSSNITAGTMTWDLDSTGSIVPMNLILDDITATGGSGCLVNGGLVM